MDDSSLSHTKFNCTYHVVLIPKYRRKAMYGQLRKDVREILKKVCEIEGVTLIDGAVCVDHVHMYISVPPKLSISSVMSRIKGKSALMIFDKYPKYKDKNGRHFWARGYYAETIGKVNEDVIKEYIKNQEDSDRIGG